MNRDIVLISISLMLVTGIVSGYKGIVAGLSAALFFSLMLLFVEWTKAQTVEDKKFITRLTGLLAIFIAIICICQYVIPSASALSLDYEFDGSQVIWQWYEGVPPYTVWDSNGLIADGYPDDWMIRDVSPGKTYTLAVTDSEGNYMARTAKAPYYTYPLEIWLLLGLFCGLLFLSIRVPFAAFGAAALGGFLMLMIGPNPDYAGYLRIIAISTFIAGLGALFIHGGKG